MKGYTFGRGGIATEPIDLDALPTKPPCDNYTPSGRKVEGTVPCEHCDYGPVAHTVWEIMKPADDT